MCKICSHEDLGNDEICCYEKASDEVVRTRKNCMIILLGVSQNDKYRWITVNGYDNYLVSYDDFRRLFAVPGETVRDGQLKLLNLGVPNEAGAFKQFFDNLLYKMSNGVPLIVDLGSYRIEDEVEIFTSLAKYFNYEIYTRSFDIPSDFVSKSGNHVDQNWDITLSCGEAEDLVSNFFERTVGYSEAGVIEYDEYLDKSKTPYDDVVVEEDDTIRFVSPLYANYSLLEKLKEDKDSKYTVFLGNYFLGEEPGGAKRILDYITINRPSDTYFLTGPSEHYLRTYLTTRIIEGDYRDVHAGRPDLRWIASRLKKLIPDYVLRRFTEEFRGLGLVEMKSYLTGLNSVLSITCQFRGKHEEKAVIASPLGVSTWPAFNMYGIRNYSYTHIGSPAYEQLTDTDGLDSKWEKVSDTFSQRGDNNRYALSVHSGSESSVQFNNSFNIQSPDLDSISVWKTRISDIQNDNKTCEILEK